MYYSVLADELGDVWCGICVVDVPCNMFYDVLFNVLYGGLYDRPCDMVYIVPSRAMYHMIGYSCLAGGLTNRRTHWHTLPVPTDQDVCLLHHSIPASQLLCDCAIKIKSVQASTAFYWCLSPARWSAECGGGANNSRWPLQVFIATRRRCGRWGSNWCLPSHQDPVRAHDHWEAGGGSGTVGLLLVNEQRLYSILWLWQQAAKLVAGD